MYACMYVSMYPCILWPSWLKHHALQPHGVLLLPLWKPLLYCLRGDRRSKRCSCNSFGEECFGREHLQTNMSSSQARKAGTISSGGNDMKEV